MNEHTEIRVTLVNVTVYLLELNISKEISGLGRDLCSHFYSIVL